MDDFRLEVRGDDSGWENVPLDNPESEEGVAGASRSGWIANSLGYTAINPAVRLFGAGLLVQEKSIAT